MRLILRLLQFTVYLTKFDNAGGGGYNLKTIFYIRFNTKFFRGKLNCFQKC